MQINSQGIVFLYPGCWLVAKSQKEKWDESRQHRDSRPLAVWI
jgi:hypothetical protein